MPSYDVRIQIQRPVAGDDGRLAAAMQAAGFSTTVHSSKGVAYSLPAGQFVFNGERALADVVKLGRKAADTLQKAYAVYASETVARAWHDLAPAPKKRSATPSQR